VRLPSLCADRPELGAQNTARGGHFSRRLGGFCLSFLACATTIKNLGLHSDGGVRGDGGDRDPSPPTQMYFLRGRIRFLVSCGQ